MEVGTAGEEVGWFGGSKQLPVDARRRPQCPRHGHPERAGRARPPAHTAAGLDLEAAVVVVLDLGADGYVDAVGNERDLVLDEPGEPLSRDVQRHECQAGVRAYEGGIVSGPGPKHIHSRMISSQSMALV